MDDRLARSNIKHRCLKTTLKVLLCNGEESFQAVLHIAIAGRGAVLLHLALIVSQIVPSASVGTKTSTSSCNPHSLYSFNLRPTSSPRRVKLIDGVVRGLAQLDASRSDGEVEVCTVSGGGGQFCSLKGEGERESSP